MDHLEVFHLGRLWPYSLTLALLSEGTSSLAYYEHSQITAVKKFYNIRPWAEFSTVDVGVCIRHSVSLLQQNVLT